MSTPERTGNVRYRIGTLYNGAQALVLQIEERQVKVLSRFPYMGEYEYSWRDARLEDLTTNACMPSLECVAR